MNLKLHFLLWCDCEDGGIQMNEVKRSKHEIVLECPKCGKTVTVNEIEVQIG